MKREMTEAQLISFCQRKDRQNKREADAAYAKEIKTLVSALTDKRCRLYPWQLEEVKRLVHEAYGRGCLGVKS